MDNIWDGVDLLEMVKPKNKDEKERIGFRKIKEYEGL